jgi:hypothetical protein
MNNHEALWHFRLWANVGRPLLVQCGYLAADRFHCS